MGPPFWAEHDSYAGYIRQELLLQPGGNFYLQSAVGTIIDLPMIHQLESVPLPENLLYRRGVAQAAFISCQNILGHMAGMDPSPVGQPNDLTDDRLVECASFTENTRPGRILHRGPGRRSR